MKTTLTLVLTGFIVFCGVLVAESGLSGGVRSSARPCILLQQTTADKDTDEAVALVSAGETAEPRPADSITLGADNSPAKNLTLGSTDPNSGFKFELELTSKGAAVRRAIFSEFSDRHYKNPQPLVILSPVRQTDGGEILSMASAYFVFVQRQMQLPLDRLQWESSDVVKAADGSQSVRFEAVIKDKNTDTTVIKLVKTYRISPGSYDLYCDLDVNNLSTAEQKVRFGLVGPTGIGKEDPQRDDRKVVAGFRDSKGQITSMLLDTRKLINAKTINDRRLISNLDNFLWASVTNKYFAAILAPVPEQGRDFCDWVMDKTGAFYNPDGDRNADSGDEAISVSLKTASTVLTPAGQAGSTRQYKFQLYLGPKNKGLFDKNELYKKLGFFHTIDFMPCFCCPAAIINPLAFGILATMKWMYGFIPNYGVVIIILVFLIRLVLHPVTKKSQVSMSKMTKLGPKSEEIKQKYANDKAEMNKQMMALYKEHGASPVMGMLPMFVQMPIWIALYGAIYASVDLRGARFLPFWITDLSAADAIVRFSVVKLPLFGNLDSLNLLPILMGVAFYLQQKLTPSQATPANAQAAQQQKMMMIMMPLLFPLMLYRAPSGLNLYIMASTFAGVIEQYVIKKHISRKEQAESVGLVETTSKTGGKVKKKKPKPFYRM